MFTAFSDFLKKKECKYKENISIKNIYPIHIETVVRIIVFPENEESLKDIVVWLTENNMSFLIVGNISNILFKSRFYNGVVIKTSKIRTKILAEKYYELGCGNCFSSMARMLSEKEISGYEGLVGIPGTVGGMVYQNAGAFGYEISDIFISARIFNSATLEIKDYDRDGMNFSYRESLLKNKNLLLLSAKFSFTRRLRQDILHSVNEFRMKRQSTQPIREYSLGSTFKRVDGISAGFYIDKAGLKGFSIGGAAVSDVHAGFLINKGGASADDMLKLIEAVKERVYHSFGIELKEEIEII